MGTTSEKLNYLAQTKADIKSAIEAKGVTVPDGTTFRQYATKIGDITGGGNIVNGVIEQYKAATTTISANTFVEFVNGLGTNSTTTVVDTAELHESESYISSVALSSTKVFIAYGLVGTTSAGTFDYLYGVVCDISGTTITAGVPTQISTTLASGDRIGVVKLLSSTVFVAYQAGGAKLYGTVCTISGTTITVGTETEIKDGTVYYGPFITALSSTKVFITFGALSSSFYGVVCTISGTTITPGTTSTITTISGSHFYSCPVTALSSTKVFIAYTAGSSSSSSLYGRACTISGTTITRGTETLLASPAYAAGEAIATTSLSSDAVFIAHNGNSTGINSRLYGIVCTISGTTITAGTDTLLSSTTYGGQGAKVVASLPNTEVFIAHNGGARANSGSGQVYGVICTISGTTITAGTDTLLAEPPHVAEDSIPCGTTTAVALDGENVLVIYKGNSDAGFPLYAVFPSERLVQPTVSKIEGLTKTECTTSTAGDVWVFSGN